jgi:hypothetical protein
MTTVNSVNPKLDLTVRVFDDFYGDAIEVPTNEYDVVNSFFTKVFTTGEAAQNFTGQLFRIAKIGGVPALTLLSQIQDQDAIKVTATIAYLLNGIRSSSTLLGINAVSTPNVWAARNVRP